MTWDPSPGDIEARVIELDANVKDEDDYSWKEWYEEAMERMLLHLATVRWCFRIEQWDDAINGLVEAANMCQKIGNNAIAQLPRDEVIRLVKNKLEVLTQHPMAVEGDFDGIVAFRPDHPVVPDTYEP